jgi:hypothetical protein
MKYRILYHNDKIFFYNDYDNFTEVEIIYNNNQNNNKLLINIFDNTVIKKYGDENIINKLLIYNLKLLTKCVSKYHIALYFTGHFLPNCDHLVELQLNNYINCTFDIFIVTERTRIYGRFYNKNKIKTMLNVDNISKINKLTDDDLYKIFGKYKDNIKKIIYIDDYLDDCQKILIDNKKYYESTYNKKLFKSFEIEYFKFLKVYHIKEEYKKDNNIVYDFVIKTRPDIILKNQIIFNELYYDIIQKNFIGQNNIFIIGNEKNIDYISQIIYHYYRYESNKLGCEYQLYLYALKRNIHFKKNIKLLRYWILNKEEYFLKEIKHIDKDYWQIY